MAQRMSVALHMAAAWEIARELSLAGAEDEAALFGGRGRRLRCLNSHRTWRVCALAPFECGGVSLCWCVWVPSAYRVWQRVW